MSATTTMRLNIGCTEAGYVVRVEGRCRLHQSAMLREFALSCLTGTGCQLVVDLSRCEHLDSTFLGCLVDLHRRFSSQASCSFAVVAPAERRMALLRPTRLDTLFSYLDSAPPVNCVTVMVPSESLDARDLGQHVIECQSAPITRMCSPIW